MRLLIGIGCMLAAVLSHAQMDTTLSRAPRWSARGQFAGLQGAGSFGLLWNAPAGRLQLGALYGHAPSSQGSQPFHVAVLRLNGSLFPVHKPQWGRWSVTPTLALSGMFDLSGTGHYALPAQYPEGYYAPSAVHALLSLGARAGRQHKGGSVAFTAELVALDTYLWYAIDHPGIGLHEAWSLALGLEVAF
jgi:hypothetical protein